MKTIHEFLASKGIKSMGQQIPALVVEQYIKEYCSDLLVFCAENADSSVKFTNGKATHSQVNKKSILKIKKLL